MRRLMFVVCVLWAIAVTTTVHAEDAGGSDAVGGSNVAEIREMAREEALACATVGGRHSNPALFGLLWMAWLLHRRRSRRALVESLRQP